MTLSIVDAMTDPALFGPHFRDLESWRPWRIALQTIFGLRMTADDLRLLRQCTGRDAAPCEQAKEAWLIVGRRGGKSRVLALIASYLATLIDWRPYLAPGERGFLVIVAADRRQCRTIMSYCRAFLAGTPMLSELIVRDNAEELELSNGITIEVATSSYRTIRGRTVIGAAADEAAFWSDEDGSNPASEVIASLRPAMATIPGSLLLVASSPYSKSGPLYGAFKRHYGKGGRVLVWKAATRVMNPSLSEAVVAEAYEEDPISAASEYGAEFRNDVDAFISREVVDAAVVPGCFELPWREGVIYKAFTDPSGGSSDSFTLGIAHAENNRRVLDVVRECKPPFSPDSVVREFASTLKAYKLVECSGDRYGGEWPREKFREHGIEYRPSECTKSELYLEMLPILNSGNVGLLDNPRLIAQLSNLERRTARSGKDSIDHCPGAHDDVANAACGALVLASSATDATTDLGAMSSALDDLRKPAFGRELDHVW